MKFKIGEMYRHYPHGKKRVLNKTISERKDILVGNKMDGSGLGYRTRELICDEECVPIVLYLGTRNILTQNCHMFLNGQIIYMLPDSVFTECGDELELL